MASGFSGGNGFLRWVQRSGVTGVEVALRLLLSLRRGSDIVFLIPRRDRVVFGKIDEARKGSQ